MNALAMRDSALSQAEKEHRLIAAFDQALAGAKETQEACGRARVVEDMRAMTYFVNAYKISDETKRKITESSLLCLRLFGLALQEEYPDVRPGQASELTGISAASCTHARLYAGQSEEQMEDHFRYFSQSEIEIGLHVLSQYIKEGDPRTQAMKYAAWQKQQDRLREANQREAAMRSDPDYEMICTVWDKVGRDWFPACKEILRLARENAMLKKKKS
jgi:hypothetical protein